MCVLYYVGDGTVCLDGQNHFSIGKPFLIICGVGPNEHAEVIVQILNAKGLWAIER